MDNPYSSPLTETSLSPQNAEDTSLGSIARATFLAWEKLRLLFNAILVGLTVSLGFRLMLTQDFWSTAIAGGVLANICYFAGPAVETYVTWLGYRGKALRIWLFTLGTLFAGILAIVTLAMLEFSKF